MKKENRDFLFKELAKGNEIIKAYQQILDNISIYDNAYNPFFVLILDSMTAKLILIISYIFDKNNDSINLKNNMVKSTKNTSWIENLKEEYKDLITFRNKAIGHLNKKTEKTNNFKILTETSLRRTKILFKKVYNKLETESEEEFKQTKWADEWPNVSSSRELFFEKLKNI